MIDRVKVFAPATIANIGPGFDVLGLAVTGGGDIVEARKMTAPGVIIEAIFGDGGRLPLAAAENTAGVAATAGAFAGLRDKAVAGAFVQLDLDAPDQVLARVQRLSNPAVQPEIRKYRATASGQTQESPVSRGVLQGKNRTH